MDTYNEPAMHAMTTVVIARRPRGKGLRSKAAKRRKRSLNNGRVWKLT